MEEPISLTATEAACLEALRAGAQRKGLIALSASLNLRQATKALLVLTSLGLADAGDTRTWRLTSKGNTADIEIVPTGRTRGRKAQGTVVAGTAAARLLALLDQPRRGAELSMRLGVTRQRIHQLVVALSARGLLRLADPTYPTFVVAHKDDTSTLLRPDQERVLSAFPATESTTLSRIAVVCHMSSKKIILIADALHDAGLIEKTGKATYGDLYRLTSAGSAHWQRSLTARQAGMPPLPFRSDRVRAVLSCLETQGPIRTRDVGVGLGISQTSMNALMQYLKRKNTVRTHTDARHAPYELTPDGRRMLAAMQGQAESANAR